jgi:hypothetical protein
MKLLTKGNEKVKALLFDLPTRICFQQCKKCYAKKSELRFPNVIKKREFNYEASLNYDFSILIKKEIEKSKYNIVRIHSSGDFYSQEYIDKWVKIIVSLPDIKFYAYTKSKLNKELKFNKLEKLSNMNLINSMTKLGVNYGNEEYCNSLIKLGYTLCPCKKNVHIDCMIDCNICLTNKNICFLEH